MRYWYRSHAPNRGIVYRMKDKDLEFFAPSNGEWVTASWWSLPELEELGVAASLEEILEKICLEENIHYRIALLEDLV